MDAPLHESPATGSIVAAQAQVQRQLTAVMALCSQPMTLAAFERQLWSILLALGRAACTLFLARAVARYGGVQHGQHASVLATRFGRVPFVRPVVRTCRGEVYRPVDRMLRLHGSASLGVIVMLAQLCTRLSFSQARAVFAATHEWRPSQDMTLRIVDATGALARSFLEQAPVPDDDGEVLVIEVDGRGAPMISPAEMLRRCQPRRPRRSTGRHARRARRRQVPRPRRTSGQKSKNAKVAIVGVIYTLRRTPEGWEGPIHKRIYATFESHEALFQWLKPEAVRRGYGKKTTLFLADGARAIWDRQQRFFPKAKTCLDWYHVVEKLWVAAACLHANDSDALAAWVATQKAQLRHGKVGTVLRTLKTAWKKTPKTGPGNKGKRMRLKSVYKHLAKHRVRLSYQRFRRHDWPIGTGIAEGAVRNLIGLRLDGPGMRWGRERAEWILHLRCILLNDQWDSFVTFLDGHPKLALAAHPTPATPYQAKERQAA
jgi:hypothetical protein